MAAAGLLLGLADGQPCWIIGACRLRVVSGAVAILGATVEAGQGVDVVSPPFESALCAEASSVVDLRLAAAESPECGAVLQHLQQRGSAGFGGAYRAVVHISSIPRLETYLDEYDCDPSDLALEWWSLRVRGACLLGLPPGIPSVPHVPLPPQQVSAQQQSSASKMAVVSIDEHGKIDNGDDEAQKLAKANTSSSSSASCRVVARPTVIPPQWRGVVDSILSHASQSTGYGVPRVLPQVLVTGPKGAGKSTFMRFLSNALLTITLQGSGDDDGNAQDGSGGADPSLQLPRLFPRGVAYLDLDIGQPEHTVPGMLALAHLTSPLLTPPHVRVHASAEASVLNVASDSCRSGAAGSSARFGAGAVVACRYIGATSPKADPDAFIAACSALLAVYRRDFAGSGIPLVINTHGWIRGVGFATIQSMINDACPSHLIHFEAETVSSYASTPYASDDGWGGPAASPSSSSLESEGADGIDAPHEDGEDNDGAIASAYAESVVGDDDEADDAVVSQQSPNVHIGRGSGAAPSTAASSPSLSARPRRPRVPPSEVFQAPPAAYQPWAQLLPVTEAVTASSGSSVALDIAKLCAAGDLAALFAVQTPSSTASVTSPPIRVWNSGLGVSVYTLQPWHVMTQQQQQPQVHLFQGMGVSIAPVSNSSSSSGGKALPPRAARSPVDLRSMRLMLYLLWGLTSHAPGEIASAASAAAANNGGGSQFDDAGDDEDGDDNDDQVSPSDDNIDDADVTAEGSAAEDGIAAKDDDAEDEDVGDDGDIAASDGAGESDDDAGADSDGDVGDGLDLSIPLTLQPPAEAVRQYWAALKRSVSSAFWRVLSEGSEARAPLTGLRSPALALALATPAVVPISDVLICISSSQRLGQARAVAGDDIRQRQLASCLHGQIVGLCSTLTSHLDPTSLPTATPSQLPCVGVGYVRCVDAERGLLSIITPVPVHRLCDVDVLACWSGAPDIPPQLLYRANPGGIDPFAVSSHALAPTSTATAKSDVNRKQLKRRRLDGGGGGTGGRGGGRGRGRGR